MCVFLYVLLFILSYLCAVDVESAKEINILESSSEPVGLSAKKEDQSYDISGIPESASCSQCLKLVMSLIVLYFYINQWFGDKLIIVLFSK